MYTQPNRNVKQSFNAASYFSDKFLTINIQVVDNAEFIITIIFVTFYSRASLPDIFLKHMKRPPS
jgi:hypothetical protein